MPINVLPVRTEIGVVTLDVLVNNCPALAMIERRWEDLFQEKQPVGSTILIKRPWRPQGRKGQAFQPEPIVQTTVPLTISYWRGVDFIYNDVDENLYMDMDRFHEDYSRPAGLQIAQQIEADLLQYMQVTIPNYVGTPGTFPTTLQTYNSAQTLLNQLLAPAERSIIYNSPFNQNIVGLSQTLFNPQREVADQYLEGYAGKYAGFKFLIDEQLPQFTVGTYAGSPVINGSNQAGSTLSIRGFTPGSTTLNPGDRLSYGTQRVNPGGVHVAYNNQPFQQIVTATATDSSGVLTASVYPALLPFGPFINANGSPVDGTTVTIAGTSGQTVSTAYAITKDAFTSAFIKLSKPANTEAAVVGGKELGMNFRGIYLRSLRQFQSSGAYAGYNTERMDVIYGFGAPYADYRSLVIYGA